MQDAWDQIEHLGRQLGASAEMVRKWRVRGVPHKWQVMFLTHSEGRKIDRQAFGEPPGPKRSADTPNGQAAAE